MIRHDNGVSTLVTVIRPMQVFDVLSIMYRVD